LLSNFLDNIGGRSEDHIGIMAWGYKRAQEVFSMVVKLQGGMEDYVYSSSPARIIMGRM
jgi:hypothetical protein